MIGVSFCKSDAEKEHRQCLFVLMMISYYKVTDQFIKLKEESQLSKAHIISNWNGIKMRLSSDK